MKQKTARKIEKTRKIRAGYTHIHSKNDYHTRSWRHAKLQAHYTVSQKRDNLVLRSQTWFPWSCRDCRLLSLSRSLVRTRAPFMYAPDPMRAQSLSNSFLVFANWPLLEFGFSQHANFFGGTVWELTLDEIRIFVTKQFWGVSNEEILERFYLRNDLRWDLIFRSQAIFGIFGCGFEEILGRFELRTDLKKKFDFS